MIVYSMVVFCPQFILMVVRGQDDLEGIASKVMGWKFVQVFQLALIVTGCVCFEEWDLGAKDTISFELMGLGAIKHNCFNCKEELKNDEKLRQGRRQLKSSGNVRVHINVDDLKECEKWAAGGRYYGCFFIDSEVVTSSVTLLSCSFEDLTDSRGRGGGFTFKGDKLVANNTIWLNCGAQKGGGLCMSSGFGILGNCTFQNCRIIAQTGDILENSNSGGALALENQMETTCESCLFITNAGGAVLMNASCGNFQNCIFSGNRGYCGGLYVTGDSERWNLTLFGCHFEGNHGFSEGSHLYIVSLG
jgi:hypothetical protein